MYRFSSTRMQQAFEASLFASTQGSDVAKLPLASERNVVPQCPESSDSSGAILFVKRWWGSVMASRPPVPARRNLAAELVELVKDAEWVAFARAEEETEEEQEPLAPPHEAEGSDTDAEDADMVCNGDGSSAQLLNCLDEGTIAAAVLARLKESLRFLLRVRVELMSPTMSGQVDEEEEEDLQRLQEAVLRTLVRKGIPAVHVARELAHGCCNWDFYVAKGSEAVHDALDHLQQEEYTYALDMALSLDHTWEHFTWLQPTRLERLWLLCKGLVTRLLAGSEDSPPELCPAVARPVWHIVTFADTETVASFAADAFRAGFMPVTHPSSAAYNEEGREVCCFMRQDEVTLPQIFEVVQNFAAAADRHGGTYCAWHTESLQAIPSGPMQEEGQAEVAFAKDVLGRGEGEV